MTTEFIREKLSRTPQKPGVYLLMDNRGEVLYVGKAKQLRNRLRSHFNSNKYIEKRHLSMIGRVSDFETIVTDFEVEALILEANFIKQKRPRYNINLKDDKSYPYIRVTSEPYPRIFVTRKIVRDGSRYFGPYTDVGSLRQLMKAIRRIFPVRTCQMKINDDTIREKRQKVCLSYHINRCNGPCEGLIPQDEYQRISEQVVAFIRGKNHQLLSDLNIRMNQLAEKRKYEEAALLRDEIKAIATFHSKQKIVDERLSDRDIVTIDIHEDDGCGMVFNVREGKIINRQHFYLTGIQSFQESEVMSSFLKQYYIQAEDIPSEIWLSVGADEMNSIEHWLSMRKGNSLQLFVPRRGEKARLVAMCTENAKLLLKELLVQKNKNVTENDANQILIELKKDLSLSKLPFTIAAFDVSNLGGQDAVASMIIFEDAKPVKSQYRKYRIRNVEGINDFEMISEVVSRRVQEIKKEGLNLPDLILVDGGKGQLNAVLTILKKNGIMNQPIIGLAKRLEEIYIPENKRPIILPFSYSSLKLLQRIRNEAHRFAINYHRKLHRKRPLVSVLDEIPGIGKKRRTALLKNFGTVDSIKNASLEEIVNVKGMTRTSAKNLKEMLTKNFIQK